MNANEMVFNVVCLFCRKGQGVCPCAKLEKFFADTSTQAAIDRLIQEDMASND